MVGCLGAAGCWILDGEKGWMAADQMGGGGMKKNFAGNLRSQVGWLRLALGRRSPPENPRDQQNFFLPGPSVEALAMLLGAEQHPCPSLHPLCSDYSVQSTREMKHSTYQTYVNALSRAYAKYKGDRYCYAP